MSKRNYAKIFPAGTTDFSTQGYGYIKEALSCVVKEVENGMYELEMVLPGGYGTEGKWPYIKEFNIIYAKPNPYKDEQPFPIYKIEKDMKGRFHVYANHISYDLSSTVVTPFTASNCNEALQGLESHAIGGTPFTFWTDKQVNATFKVTKPQSLRSLLGGQEGSILDVYGKGQYEFDGFQVKLHLNRGVDRGVTLRYGKNLTDFSQEIECSAVYSHVMPFYHTDASGDEPEVYVAADSPVSTGTTLNPQRVLPLDLTTNFSELVDGQGNKRAPTKAELVTAAQAYITANKPGVPKVSMNLSYQSFEQAIGYENMQLLSAVLLCDTLSVHFDKLDVDTSAKIVGLTYDQQNDRYKSVSLGDAKSSFTDKFVATAQTAEQAAQDAVVAQDMAEVNAEQINQAKIDIQEAQEAADQAEEHAQQAITAAGNANTAIGPIRDDIDELEQASSTQAQLITGLRSDVDSHYEGQTELASLVEDQGTAIDQNADYIQSVAYSVSNIDSDSDDALAYAQQCRQEANATLAAYNQAVQNYNEVAENPASTPEMIAQAQEAVDRANDANARAQSAASAAESVYAYTSHREQNDTAISQNSQQISLRATTTYVDSVKDRADDAYDLAEANASDLSGFITSVGGDIDNLQAQIDGSIQTFFYPVVPQPNDVDGTVTNTSNTPASDWTTNTIKGNHLGDLYYDTNTGYCYRWQVMNQVYRWSRITDVDVTKALADAAQAQDTADGKRRVFVVQPTPPYDVGDLWVQGTDGDILRCATAKTQSQSYVRSDWVKASKYTDDSEATRVAGLLTAYQNTTDGTLSDLQTQLDGKVETWFKTVDPTTSNAPASTWSTTAIKNQHSGDLYFNTSNNTLWRWTGTAWSQIQDQAAINAASAASTAQSTADGKATVFTGTTTPTGAREGDLWFKGATEPILTYHNNAWAEFNKYTDDTEATRIGGLLTAYQTTTDSTLSDLQDQIDNKVETWYKTVDPTTSNDPASTWTTDALKTEHTGDLYFNTTGNTLWRWTGTAWSRIQDATAVSAASAASQAQTAADGKATVFTGTTAPSGMQRGDLWFKSADDPILTYNGTAWVELNKYTDDTAVENLQIGGRNLVIQKNRSIGYIKGNADDGSLEGGGGGNKEKTSEFIPVEPGDVLQLQYWVTLPNPFYDRYGGWLGYRLYGEDKQPVSVRPNKYTSADPGERTYLNYVITVPTTGASSAARYIRVSWRSFDHDDTLVKLEKGTKATDWTPAPEDMATDADLTDLTTRVTQAETNITNNSTEINLRATRTEVETSINNLEIGGRNLVYGEFKVGGLGSSQYNNSNRVIPKDNLTIPVDPNAPYIFRTWNKFDDSTYIYVGVHEQDIDGNHLKDSGWKVSSNNGGYAFTTLSDTAAVRFTLRSGDPDGVKSASELLGYIGDGSLLVKLEKGNKATDWTPAPEDVEFEIGENIRSVTNLYYASNSTTPPAKPTAHVTTSNESTRGAWNLALPGYNADYPYLYTCKEMVTAAGAYTWSSVVSTTYTAKIAQMDADLQVTAEAITAEVWQDDIQEVVSNAVDESYNKVISMGENLVVNGTGYLLDNTNFSEFTFDGSEAASTASGSFSATGKDRKFGTDEYIPVSSDKMYTFSYYINCPSSTVKHYDMLLMYDVDKNRISDENVVFVPGSTTTLGQELNNGDTVIHFTDLSGFKDNYNGNYSRGLIFWNYKNSYGYQYPVEYYSRNYYGSLWTDDSVIDRTNNTITLSSPWNKGTFPAGTSVSQKNSGGTHIYGNAQYSVTANTWTEKRAVYFGIGKNNASGKFRPGTAFVKPSWYINYSGADNNTTTRISNISLTSLSSATDTANALSGSENLLGNTGFNNMEKAQYQSSNSANTFGSIAGYNTSISALTAEDYDGKSKAGVLKYGRATGNNGISFFSYPGSILPGDTIWITCWYKVSNPDTLGGVRYCAAWRSSHGSNYGGWYNARIQSTPEANTWVKYQVKSTMEATTNAIGDELQIAICYTPSRAGTVDDTFTLAHLKVEKGEFPTDWSPAYGDSVIGINNAQSTATAARAVADANARSVEEQWSIGTRTASNGTWVTAKVEPTEANPYIWRRTKFTAADGTVSYTPNANGILSSEDSRARSLIAQTANSIALTVANSSASAGITIGITDADGNTRTSSGTITMTGLVKFTDLSTSGQTTINGGNITTGTINAIDITGCDITGGTITQTSGTDRMVMADGDLQLYNGNTATATLANTSGRGGILFRSGGNEVAYLGDHAGSTQAGTLALRYTNETLGLNAYVGSSGGVLNLYNASGEVRTSITTNGIATHGYARIGSYLAVEENVTCNNLVSRMNVRSDGSGYTYALGKAPFLVSSTPEVNYQYGADLTLSADYAGKHARLYAFASPVGTAGYDTKYYDGSNTYYASRIGCNANGGGYLSLYNSDGYQIAGIYPSDAGSELKLKNSSGTTVVRFYTNGDNSAGGLMIMNASGNTIAQIGYDGTNAALGIWRNGAWHWL